MIFPPATRRGRPCGTRAAGEAPTFTIGCRGRSVPVIVVSLFDRSRSSDNRVARRWPAPSRARLSCRRGRACRPTSKRSRPVSRSRPRSGPANGFALVTVSSNAGPRRRLLEHQLGHCDVGRSADHQLDILPDRRVAERCPRRRSIAPAAQAARRTRPRRSAAAAEPVVPRYSWSDGSALARIVAIIPR